MSLIHNYNYLFQMSTCAAPGSATQWRVRLTMAISRVIPKEVPRPGCTTLPRKSPTHGPVAARIPQPRKPLPNRQTDNLASRTSPDLPVLVKC